METNEEKKETEAKAEDEKSSVAAATTDNVDGDKVAPTFENPLLVHVRLDHLMHETRNTIILDF